MQNLSVQDIFPSSVPKLPRVQSPVLRDIQGNQFSDYFTPPSQPVYRPLGNTGPDITMNRDDSQFNTADQEGFSMKASSAGNDKVTPKPEFSRDESPGTGAEKSRKEAVDESADARKSQKNAGKLGKDNNADSDKNSEIASKKTSANTSGNETAAAAAEAGDNSRSGKAVISENTANGSEDGAKESAKVQLAAASDKNATKTTEAGNGISTKKSTPKRTAEAQGKTDQAQSGQLRNGQSHSDHASLAGDAKKNGDAGAVNKKAVSDSQKMASAKDEGGVNALGEKKLDIAQGKPAGDTNISGKDGVANSGKQPGKESGGEFSVKDQQKFHASRGGAEGTKTSGVQSSILSQSMERISGRGSQAQNTLTGSSSGSGSGGDSQVLSSMIQSGRSGSNSAGGFNGSGGEGSQGENSRQMGTFSNTMFAQSPLGQNSSSASANEFQVFLGPEAMGGKTGAMPAGASGPNSPNGGGGRQTMSSSEMMNQFKEQFRGQLGSDVVRQARYILKGENSGEISMVLKPEKLGRVRIKVNLQDNSVEGKIFVENKEVEAAFNEMADDLEAMFQEQGFDHLSVDVQLENSGSDNPQDPFGFADDSGSALPGNHTDRFENQIAQARNYLREYETLDILA